MAHLTLASPLLQDAASDLGNELRASLPTLASLGITIGQSASQGVANMPDASVDEEGILDAAKEAAAAAGAAVGAADEAGKAAAQEAAAALAGAVPLVSTSTTRPRARSRVCRLPLGCCAAV